MPIAENCWLRPACTEAPAGKTVMLVSVGAVTDRVMLARAAGPEVVRAEITTVPIVAPGVTSPAEFIEAMDESEDDQKTLLVTSALNAVPRKNV